MKNQPRTALASAADVAQFERDSASTSFWTPASQDTVFDALKASAARFGDAAALIYIDSVDGPAQVLSHRQLLEGVTRAANVFARLGGAGCGVAYILPSWAETQCVLWGAETCGYAVPLNPFLQPAEIADLVKASGATVFVFPAGDLPGVRERVEAVRAALPGTRFVAIGVGSGIDGAIGFGDACAAEPGDALGFDVAARDAASVVAYFHTGGTTGLPKLVAHTSANQLCAAAGAAALLDLRPADRMTNGMPMFHVGGTIASSLALFLSGASIVMLSGQGFRNPAMVSGIWKIVERFQATILGAVPTALGALLTVPVDADIASLRWGLTGASSCPLSVNQRFREVTGLQLHELLGMTETGGVVAADPVGGTSTPGSVGLRIPHSSLRIRRLKDDGTLGEDCAAHEVGVLFVQGPHVSPGYLHAEQNRGVFVDGGLNTGDLAYLDEAGKLFIAGRSKDLIIRSGHNIDPPSIEQAFNAHPAIALSAAVGQPDAYAGELPVVFVLPKPGAAVDVAELQDFARERIGERPAWPKAVHVVDALPMTAVGKLYKPALRAEAARRLLVQQLEPLAPGAVRTVEAREGGKRGLEVRVTLARDDAATRAAVEGALGGFTFAWTVLGPDA